MLPCDQHFATISCTRRDIERVERNLKALVADPQHAQNRDREFSGFVARQFERVYGSGLAEPDATGRARPVVPIRADIEVFRPKPRRGDLSFGRGVGPGEANQPADVMRAQRLLSNAGAFSFAVPEERSGRVSPALDRATRQFQASRGLTVDGRIVGGGETLRNLDATLFAADEAKEPPDEEFPEEPPNVPGDPKEPPKEEFPEEPPEGVEPEEPSDPKDPKDPPKKLEDPEKDKKKECASLAQDLANARINEQETSERFRTANEGIIRTRKKIAALEIKLKDSRKRNSGNNAAKGFADGIIGGIIKGRKPSPPALLFDGLIGAMKGIGAAPATNTESEKISQELEVEKQNLVEFRRQTEFELSVLEEIKAEISEIKAKMKALGC